MLKEKLPGFMFSVIMSYSMTVGMEIYNTAIVYGFHAVNGSFSLMTYEALIKALTESTYMGLIVIVVSTFVGHPLGMAFQARYCDPEHDNPYFCRIMLQVGTMAAMCPSMCLIASIMYNIIMNGEPVWRLPVIWIGTMIKNLPMAFFWNLFVAAPFTNWLHGKLFRRAA